MSLTTQQYTTFQKTNCNALSECWEGQGILYNTTNDVSLINPNKKYFVVFRHKMIEKVEGTVFQPLLPYQVTQSGHGWSMRILDSYLFPSSNGYSRGAYILSPVYLCDEDNISVAIATASQEQTKQDKQIKVAKNLSEIQNKKIKIGLLDVYYPRPFARKETFAESFMGMPSYSSDKGFIKIENLDGIWTDGTADLSNITNFLYYV